MRKLFIILVVLIVDSGCGDDSVIDLKKVYQEDDIFYYGSESTPFTGNGISYFGNEKVESKASFIDGKLDGKLISYYENGYIDQKLKYKLGVEIDTSYNYYDNSQVAQIIIWKDEKQNGYLKGYHRNGKLMEEGELVDGFMNGYWSFFYETGVQKSFEIYNKYVLIDSSVSYYQNGVIESKGYYNNGLANGKFTYYDSLTGKIDGYQIFKNDSLILTK
jgi:antitoxin component YwqK of YwqJK toxin-antitoxin module